MTLQFFRRHKKWFLGLMAAAVFAMVTFGALAYAGDAWSRLVASVTGKKPNDPDVYMVFGEGVSRSEVWQARENLEACFKFGEVAGMYAQQMRRAKNFDQKVSLLMRHITPLPGQYNLAKTEADKRKI